MAGGRKTIKELVHVRQAKEAGTFQSEKTKCLNELNFLMSLRITCIIIEEVIYTPKWLENKDIFEITG